MRVHLTFDVEIWCNGWNRLDEAFPRAFERYVWGRSAQGDYALPHNLKVLQDHGLVAVFFVEPLFSLRFGQEHLRTITGLITEAGQDVQLHLHAEWVDEIRPALIDDTSRKRQHLTHYTLPEQVALLTRGRQLIEAATGRPVSAFRAGSYAANRDSYRALAAAGIGIDSSLNATRDHSSNSLGSGAILRRPSRIEGVDSYPVTVFRDGLGRDRHLQVGACGFAEMRDVLDRAHDQGLQDLVLVSHNFELLKPGSIEPDFIVARRFERLCKHLAGHSNRFQVQPFPAPGTAPFAPSPPPELHAGAWSTGCRYIEQARRRLG
jgi:peptidoglycan/xylan/chitin deacetylase (PgdA/CDA1 family)